MLTQTELDRARSYARTGSVPGWLTPAAAYATIELAGMLSVQGRPVCEIGVHQGKFAILLALLSSGRLVGYDLFAEEYRDLRTSLLQKGKKQKLQTIAITPSTTSET